MSLRYYIKQLLKKVVKGRVRVSEATALLMQEMGQGGRILVVDENLLGLADELTKLGYTVIGAAYGASVAAIKKNLGGQVLITHNGMRFIADQTKYHYGLIWVTSKLPDCKRARKIESLMSGRSGFKKNLIQMFKI